MLAICAMKYKFSNKHFVVCNVYRVEYHSIGNTYKIVVFRRKRQTNQLAPHQKKPLGQTNQLAPRQKKPLGQTNRLAPRQKKPLGQTNQRAPRQKKPLGQTNRLVPKVPLAQKEER
jgi:hypothetical protein